MEDYVFEILLTEDDIKTLRHPKKDLKALFRLIKHIYHEVNIEYLAIKEREKDEE